eukprot:TRINITY_DN22727_c0_g1_i1.p1 TRINITY_DN22727_c0_g1~~TRINITY_DN22727_c0_g1_i1.p1  ORF type:complete len:301 (+),score=82.48 TRINITY_DN22727_c0_g1_i1:90-992(+)
MNFDITVGPPAKRQKVSEKPKKIVFPQHIQLVVPGQPINAESGSLRGHGTYQQDDQLFSSVCGIVERVNKLITVKPLKARYTGEIGDVVVGRIASVGQKSWKVEVNSKQDAVLMLSAINLPGGVQRRRTTSDELQMRSFFVEQDVISAEVQQIHSSDGLLVLHTRNLKYGKLTNGQLVKVHSALIKRVKNHFHQFAFGVDVIVGNNGLIWVGPRVKEEIVASDEIKKEYEPVTPTIRERISRVRQAILALNAAFVAIYPETIGETYAASVDRQLSARDMPLPQHSDALTQRARLKGAATS